MRVGWDDGGGCRGGSRLRGIGNMRFEENLDVEGGMSSGLEGGL